MESLETAQTVLYSVISPFTQPDTVESAWCHRTGHLLEMTPAASCSKQKLSHQSRASESSTREFGSDPGEQFAFWQNQTVIYSQQKDFIQIVKVKVYISEPLSATYTVH